MILIDINNLIISISNSKFVSHGHLKLMNIKIMRMVVIMKLKGNNGM